MYYINNTIVALATPPGEGALGIIRLSGTDAVHIAEKIFRGKKLSQQQSHTVHFGKIADGAEIIDEVVITLYCAPRSYTGENIIEISCHGSHYILQRIIDLCIRQGAVPARPGEFTFRAFLKGKMDLAQAEAVADLIASESSAAHHAAMYQLRGGFSAALRHMRDQLIQFSALIELELDFSQEDVEFADRTKLYELVQSMQAATQKLLQSFSMGNVIKNGVSVAIIGRPNAGKSTLLNTLLNEERAIVSHIAGTTRDTIEETINIQGILFRFIDTAGIREHSTDDIENIGMQRSRDAMQKADIVIYLFDARAARQNIKELKEQAAYFRQHDITYILAANKTDEVGIEQAAAIYDDIAEPILYISAKNREGIENLQTTLYNQIMKGHLHPEGAIVTNTRHYAALQQVMLSLDDVTKGLDDRLTGDLLALDIRRCLHYLGEITGEITTEDKLDYIFSKFCIGK